MSPTMRDDAQWLRESPPATMTAAPAGRNYRGEGPAMPQPVGLKNRVRINMRPAFRSALPARAAFYCLLVLCLGALHVRGLHAVEVKNVLVLFPEEAWSAPAYQTIYQAIKSVLDETPTHEVTLFGESLDLYLFPDDTGKQTLAEFLEKKFGHIKFDLLIPVAPSGVRFILQTRDTIFPGIPVVYCAEVAGADTRLEHRSDVTGTALTLDAAGTIELARRLHPGLKRIAAVAGTSLVDEYLLSLVHAAFEADAGTLELIDLTGLPFDTLLDKVAALPAATVILYASFQKDPTGRLFSSAATQELVSQAANAPLYSFIDTALGYGTVGGRMSQIEAMGRKTGEIALRVLSGESISAIEPAVIRENPAMFDWRELNRWGVDQSLLPAGSSVRFKEVWPWESYRWWIIGTFAFICLQTLLIVLLVNNQHRRRRAEEQSSQFRIQLARMSRVSTVGQLGQNLSHEINQPLAAIRVNAEAAQKLLEEERPDLAEVHAALGDIVADNQRAQAVVVCIRNLVKNNPPELTPVDLNRVAADAVKVVQAYAASKQVAVQMELNADLPAVLGDTVQLQQVALNFLLNAVDSVSLSPSQPRRVTVKTAADRGRGVSLCVSDTGPGIDPEAAQRIFEPFFTTKPQGLGLGLSICRSIAEAHGGYVGSGSNLEKGATFCLYLPAAPAKNLERSAGEIRNGG